MGSIQRPSPHGGSTRAGIPHGGSNGGSNQPPPLTEREWWHQWTQTLSCWWIASPWRSGLSACYGALGLALAQRFERLAPQHVAPQHGAPQHAPLGAAEPGCEWLGGLEVGGGLELPEFPALGELIEFSLPPIPRLLPPLERLQAFSGDPPTALPRGRWSAVGAAIAGVPAGALLAAVAIAARRCRSRKCGRTSLKLNEGGLV